MKMFGYSQSFEGQVDQSLIVRTQSDSPRFLFIQPWESHVAEIFQNYSWIITVRDVKEAETIIRSCGV